MYYDVEIKILVSVGFRRSWNNKKLFKKFVDRFNYKDMTFSVVTGDCDEVIFPNVSHGGFHTSMFTTTEDINSFTGEMHNKNQKPRVWSLHYHTT